MTIHDIENLSFAELKEQSSTLIEVASKYEPADLAKRYIQARQDAKLRDEKLAEQGRTINALNDGLSASVAQATDLNAKLQEALNLNLSLKATLEKANFDSAAALKKASDNLQLLQQGFSSETERANRLKAEAIRNHSALIDAASVLNRAIAAQNIDDVG